MIMARAIKILHAPEEKYGKEGFLVRYTVEGGGPYGPGFFVRLMDEHYLVYRGDGQPFAIRHAKEEALDAAYNCALKAAEGIQRRNKTGHGEDYEIIDETSHAKQSKLETAATS